ncbi:hypothetical protein K505DRAFT_342982 [Melanomma pulvis-pyrius CBS 109.77]|uniref:Uncharacterized protein n=1 Tax=Melanomma pulvis-pyrius CBS 109.77 TaxID=1314802 RepID=A0A6A6WU71_9PLEO|nr:hypothetical protein K505DRAFT_342982 [Melanomma pulvis-pyrius CBS 109.77]
MVETRSAASKATKRKADDEPALASDDSRPAKRTKSARTNGFPSAVVSRIYGEHEDELEDEDEDEDDNEDEDEDEDNDEDDGEYKDEDEDEDDDIEWTGFIYGSYIRNCFKLAIPPLDFTTFVDALPTGHAFKFKGDPALYMSTVLEFEEKIKADSKAQFAEKSANIKLVIDIMGSARSDIQCSSPDHATQMNIILHNMHSCAKAGAIFLQEYTQTTKEDLEVVQNAQERLQRYGSEEEVRLQKKVVESVNERLERLQELERLLGEE